MIKKMNKTGQTALILILLTAAALIFLAITLNWGRIAQTKAVLSIAADQSASVLASEAASYGEMEKQTYLGNQNETSSLGGLLISIVLLVLVVIAAFIPGIGWASEPFLIGAAIAMAVINLILQLVVVQPGITSLWNKLQKDQPIQQQFYEQGISTALQGAVTDQTNITDYFDLNTNGKFGLDSKNFPNDTISRFAFFYTDRLKMLNKKPMTQVAFFYDQLGKFINGETCAQNENDNFLYPNLIALNPACSSFHCRVDPADPSPLDLACQMKIPGGFQLSESCSDSDSTSPNYNPYCDPCCQPASEPDPYYNANNPNPLHPRPNKALRPSNCPADVTTECATRNPYGANYPYLYDPAYQNYANGLSFLAQFGRDQQMIPSGSRLPLSTMTPQGDFPNGVYPFFWLMKSYSPRVDNIDPTGAALLPSQLHWCAQATQPVNGVNVPQFTTPAGFSDLTQLGQSPYNLTYTCQGQECCVDYLADSVVNNNPAGVNANVVIDRVDSASLDQTPQPNPVLDTVFGEQGNHWLPGDNQMCVADPWPYNGSTLNYPDGTCEWTNGSFPPRVTNPVNSDFPVHFLSPTSSTLDSLDDTMHTLSDFVNFSNNFLNQDVGKLSSTFDSWYSQAAAWIAPSCGKLQCSKNQFDKQRCLDTTCNPGADGRLLSIYALQDYPNVPGVQNVSTPVDRLQAWGDVITNWLKNDYTSTSAWCLPPEASLLGSNSSSAEDTYINGNSGIGSWGDLPHVISCLNYNGASTGASLGAAPNYQQCQLALTAALKPGVCLSALPPECDPKTLGRTLLLTPAPVYTGGPAGRVCAPATDPFTQWAINTYQPWLKNSFILANGEAPKFALRAQFLQDIYQKAINMQTMFAQGDAALREFLAPCAGHNCENGGPAAQLIYAHTQGQPVATLPNSVIYGWVDKMKANGQAPGYAHIVKVTVYAPGRNGNPSVRGDDASGFVSSELPWINTWTDLIDRYFALAARDGYVYVNVKRWDEDHGDTITFPNKHLLWQFLYHNPQSNINTTGNGLPSSCIALQPLNSTLMHAIGFGLQSQTVYGLQKTITGQDQSALANAFMLNDEGDGSVDSNASGPNGKVCSSGSSSFYCQCLSDVSTLLEHAPSSHACAEYIASRDASHGSDNNASDYSLKFVDCNTIPNFNQPDDLTGDQ